MKEYDEVTDDEYVDPQDLMPKKRVRKSNDSDLLEFV